MFLEEIQSLVRVGGKGNFRKEIKIIVGFVDDENSEFQRVLWKVFRLGKGWRNGQDEGGSIELYGIQIGGDEFWEFGVFQGN